MTVLFRYGPLEGKPAFGAVTFLSQELVQGDEGLPRLL